MADICWDIGFCAVIIEVAQPESRAAFQGMERLPRDACVNLNGAIPQCDVGPGGKLSRDVVEIRSRLNYGLPIICDSVYGPWHPVYPGSHYGLYAAFQLQLT